MDDAFLTLHLQQAWLRSQIDRKPSPPTKATSDASDPSQNNKGMFSAPLMGIDRRSSIAETDVVLNSGSNMWNFQALQQSPSIDVPGLWSSQEPMSSVDLVSEDWAASNGEASAYSGLAAPMLEGDTIMDPVLQYISDMLMDEEMEDRKCMMQECIAYHAMAKGFFGILGEDVSPQTTCSNGLSPNSSTDTEDYNWIDEVLNVEPQGASGVVSSGDLSGASNTPNGSVFSSQWSFDSSPSNGESEGVPHFSSQWSLDSSGSSSTLSGLPDSPVRNLGLQDNLLGNVAGLNEKPYGMQDNVFGISSQFNENVYMNVLPQSSSLPESPLHNFVAQDDLFRKISDSNGYSHNSAPPDGFANSSPNGIALPDLLDSILDGTILLQGDVLANGAYHQVVPGSRDNLVPMRENVQWLVDSKEDITKIRSAGTNKEFDDARLSHAILQPYAQSDAGIPENVPYVRAASGSILKDLGLSQEIQKQHGNNGHALQPSITPAEPPAPFLLSKESTVSKGTTSETTFSYVLNENLNAEMCAAKLYREGPLPIPVNGNPTHNQRKHDAGAAKEGSSNAPNGKRVGKPEPDAVDLRALLVSCAQAVASDDLRKANEILQEIRQHSSPHGNGVRRLAHYFAEGLFARLSGTGGRLYTVISNNRPSAADILKGHHLLMGVCPFTKLSHYFANQSILKAAESASRLHIVDYGILYGFQWPSLISVLAERKGGPPHLRITGIDFPQPGIKPKERIEETGRRLAEYARTYGVPFEFHAVANKWESIQPASLNLRKDEVLVVNCIYRLRHLMDESVIASSPRNIVLSKIRSMNPKIFVEGVLNASYNAPFFVSRFREALFHYSSKFDILDTNLEGDSAERLMMEREVFGRDILNIVACEGMERVERPETYRQWQSRTQRAGFELLPVDLAVLKKAQAVVKNYYHKDFGVDEDGKWMLLNWKGRIMHALAAWKPSPVKGSKTYEPKRRAAVGV